MQGGCYENKTRIIGKHIRNLRGNRFRIEIVIEWGPDQDWDTLGQNASLKCIFVKHLYWGGFENKNAFYNGPPGPKPFFNAKHYDGLHLFFDGNHSWFQQVSNSIWTVTPGTSFPWFFDLEGSNIVGGTVNLGRNKEDSRREFRIIAMNTSRIYRYGSPRFCASW